MSLDMLAMPRLDGGRFLLVDYLPTYAAVLFLVILIWAGAPGPDIDFDSAWRSAANLGVGEAILITIAITLMAAVTHPLQLAMMRILEGGWPAWARPLTVLSQAIQQRRRDQLAARGELPEDPAETLSEEQIQAAGLAGTRLRRMFPPPDLTRPTALGNALAAMEVTAGEPYGFDAVVAWPRLYPVLGERMRIIIDDRRNTLDSAARMSATMAVTTVISALALAQSGWWLLLSLIPLALARIAYIGAVRAATAYGETVRTAFDLHRFDLLTALRLPLPEDPETERRNNTQLCDSWRQGIPAKLGYCHPEPGPWLGGRASGKRY
ncbi:MAG TPA: hypothetical protein VGS19_25270 [Streptosporangiaceae bacterium]|nr:hypothetical protein [Streptosporangiaceae bacterium]